MLIQRQLVFIFSGWHIIYQHISEKEMGRSFFFPVGPISWKNKIEKICRGRCPPSCPRKKTVCRKKNGTNPRNRAWSFFPVSGEKNVCFFSHFSQRQLGSSMCHPGKIKTNCLWLIQRFFYVVGCLRDFWKDLKQSPC